MREGYGPFNVSLDGQTVTRTAAGPGNGLFQEALFSKTKLSRGTHTLQLVNIGLGTSVDIDFITFTTGDGDDRYVLSFFIGISQSLSRPSRIFRSQTQLFTTLSHVALVRVTP